MRIVCEPTHVLTELRGCPVRLWRADLQEDDGRPLVDHKVHVFIACLAIPEAEPAEVHETLANVLQELPVPQELSFTQALDVRHVLP